MKARKYYSGDKVTLKSDHFPENPAKGFSKGDKAVILDAVEVEKDLWEVDIEINKNKSSCLVLGKEVEVYQRTPIQIEQKNYIGIGRFKAILTQDETFILYKRIQKIKNSNKKKLMFKSKTIQFKTVEDIEIVVQILQKTLKPTHHLD